MKTRLIQATVAFLLLLPAASSVQAQQRASSSIDGFNGLSWGASESDIRARFGEPAKVDSLENGVVVLAYREELLGEPAVAFYALLGTRGMVKGQHVVKLHLGEGDCEGQYRTYRDHVKLAYPLIVPVESFDFPFTDDFCTALENGEGEWMSQWTDPANGAVITVIVQRGSDEVLLVYESATFLEWLGPEANPEGEG
jgi:hypothetical protein